MLDDEERMFAYIGAERMRQIYCMILSQSLGCHREEHLPRIFYVVTDFD